MNCKKWCLGTLCLVLALLVLMGAATAVIDPYFHYHAPLASLQYPLDSQRYQNDGIARHFSYDALITGTSLTENFRTSEFDALFGANTVKLCCSGGTYSELCLTLEQAIRSNPQLKTVLFGLDEWFLLGGRDLILASGDYPTYLYDDNPFNDVNYLFNREIFFGSTLRVLQYTRQGNATTSFDDYGSWGELYAPYTARKVLDGYQRLPQSDTVQVLTEGQRALLRETLTDTALRLARENPQIQFLYFFPPYSVLNWDNNLRQGIFEQYLAAYEEASALLLEAENIQLYAFHTDFDTITNLDNYRDIVHYSPEINSLILERIARGEYRLTKENYRAYWQQVGEFYRSYDYAALLGETN